MLIAWRNLADEASLSASSELPELPGSNVQQPHVSRKWSTDEADSAYLLLDMGEAVSCALLALLGTNLTPAATVRLRGSLTDSSATGSLELDTGTLAAGAKAEYGNVFKSFTSTSARYWRLDVADASLEALLVGRLFLGPKWEPSVNMQIGWHLASEDPSVNRKSYGGQLYSDVRPQQRVLEFTLDFLEEAEMYTNAMALARAQGITGDVLVIPDISGTYLSEQAVYGPCRAAQPIVERDLGIFRQKYIIEERL